jgi:hypothetical protein
MTEPAAPNRAGRWLLYYLVAAGLGVWGGMAFFTWVST